MAQPQVYKFLEEAEDFAKQHGAQTISDTLLRLGYTERHVYNSLRAQVSRALRTTHAHLAGDVFVPTARETWADDLDIERGFSKVPVIFTATPELKMISEIANKAEFKEPGTALAMDAQARGLVGASRKQQKLAMDVAKAVDTEARTSQLMMERMEAKFAAKLAEERAEALQRENEMLRRQVELSSMAAPAAAAGRGGVARREVQ